MKFLRRFSIFLYFALAFATIRPVVLQAVDQSATLGKWKLLRDSESHGRPRCRFGEPYR